MSITIERNVSRDALVKPESLNGYTFTGEAGAHTFVITTTRRGASEALTGTVTANFLRADNENVAMGAGDCSLVGGKAVVTLRQECYNVPGRFLLTVYVTNGSETEAVYSATGNVQRTSSDTYVDTGIIPDFASLSAAQEAANEAAALANAAAEGALANFAPAFVAANANAAGTYVTYTDGKLYLLPDGHTANATWANTSHTEVTFNSEHSSLKSQISGKVDISQGVSHAGEALIIGQDGNVTTGEAGVTVDTTLTIPGKAADAKAAGDAIAAKVSEPDSEGTAGQMLTTDGDGGRSWTSPQAPTDEQVHEAVEDYLDEHPEALESATPLPAKNFLRVGCIGDSYTEGYVNLGTTPAGSISTCAWPYFLSKLTGHEWTNFGIHASGVKTWIEGTNGLTRLSEVQAAGNVCQAYVIGLMLNDCKPGLTAYVPVGDAEDIGTENNSYYAYYYRLIQAVHAVNPAAPIFVLTCPGTDKDSKLIPYNTALRAIAAYCKTTAGLPVYLCDLDGEAYNNTRYFKHPVFNADYVGGHYTGIGYEMMAECLLRVISDTMVANSTEFRTIQQIPYDDNTVLTKHEIRIGALEASVSPEWLQAIVSSGRAQEYFAIGDTINIPWTNYQPSTPVLYSVPFRVVHFGDAYDANNMLHRNAMWLQAQYAIPQQMRFDQPEEIQETGSTFESGYYYYVKSGNDYVQQTVTPGAAIPSGVTYYKHVKANAGDAIAKGSNVWSESGYRQWLNGTGAKNTWWTAQHGSDLAPYQLSTVPGFMYGFTEAWRALFKPVKVTTALNTVSEDGTTAVTYDRFFLPSLEQVYGVPEVSGAEGVYWEYWKQATGLDEPSNGDNDHRSDARKIALVSDISGNKVTTRLRSAKRSSGKFLYVNGSAGYIADNSTPDQSTMYSTPCCVLY